MRFAAGQRTAVGAGVGDKNDADLRRDFPAVVALDVRLWLALQPVKLLIQLEQGHLGHACRCGASSQRRGGDRTNGWGEVRGWGTDRRSYRRLKRRCRSGRNHTLLAGIAAIGGRISGSALQAVHVNGNAAGNRPVTGRGHQPSRPPQHRPSPLLSPPPIPPRTHRLGLHCARLARL